MKRSKLFLGATTCLLAVAGIAATKASKLTTLYTRYYCTGTSTNAKCRPIQSACTNIGTDHLCTIVLSATSYTLFKEGNKDNPVLCSTTTNNCSTPITYKDVN